MKRFRLLNADEIECRVSICKENGLSLLLYKTARTDADILDETFGAERWENDFKLVDGVLYGGIGIDYGDNEKLVWKWDAGTESNTEAEKGRASDAFKRAGFKHGIGRELYSAPFIWIPSNKCEIEIPQGKKPTCKDTFSVSEIGYDDNEKICKLIIVNDKSKMPVFEMGVTYSNEEICEDIICADCGDTLRPITKRDGEIWEPAQIALYSEKRFKRCLCPDCQREALEKEKT